MIYSDFRCRIRPVLFLLILTPVFLLPLTGCARKAPVRPSRAQMERESDLPEVVFDRYGWVRVRGYTFQVELALSQEQRTRGLMFREHLGKDEGMFFVFDKEEPRSFWMKNVPIPLSVAFIDSRGTVVSVKNMNPLSTESVLSGGPALYVLEAAGGRLQELGVRPGDRVEWGEY